MSARFVFLPAALILTGCVGIYTPLIDKKDARFDPVVYAQDLDECRAYAKTVNPITGAMLGAGVMAGVGAAVGAVAGAVYDVDVSDMAGRGAALGGTVGGFKGLGDSLNRQMTIVDNCMRGRDYKVL